jgi:hypothetical protein
MTRTTVSRCAILSTVVAVLVSCAKADRESTNDSGTAMSAADTTATPAVPAKLGSAEYTIVVKSRWTRAEHPLEWPSDAHFSGLIGATHTLAYSIFAIGTPPTPGLENLSEQGKHTPLDSEIRSAVSAGNAGMLFESGPLRNFADSIVTAVKVDDAFPLVSLVMMVAPSPDWFTGVRDVDLRENGAWTPAKTLDLVAYDSGGDDGTTYKAPDRDTNPKKPTSQSTTPHFIVNGSLVPVGTITFARK